MSRVRRERGSLSAAAIIVRLTPREREIASLCKGRAEVVRRIIATCVLAANTLFIAPVRAQNSPAPPISPSGPTPTTTNQQPPSTLPTVSDAVNPAAALDYDVQYPLFGNLTFRQDLHDEGIDLAAHYINETMSNTAGYKGTGTDWAQQFDIGASFDLGKLGVWSDAIARFAMSDRTGRSTAADYTGSYFAYQEIYGQGQNTRIDELSIEKTLPAQGVAIKVGFYPLGNDFGTLPYVCNFVNVAFCGHPQSLPTNSGWSDGPAGRWGGRIKWHITDSVTLQAGAFDVNPLVTRRQDGFKLSLTGSTGVLVPVELGYQIGKDPSDYAGTYKIGAYYDSSNTPDLANPHMADDGRYGLYVEAAQQVFKAGPGLRNGLALFAIYTISDQATAKFKDYVEAGLAYRGLIPGRDLDLLSLGYVRADINSRLQAQMALTGQPVQTSEELLELNYTIQVLPSLTFRPDVQYDIRPGALSNRPDTWVFGAQIKLTL
ncbi:carbohydrate porin [Rhodanobacter sp. C03]|uniref:carbohydrate porin n=1 Tax=Rhodanobacter sp. C03 TaxID=1945858 RepID=UPI00098502D3|nr:carbohydrate porin [Rhodanobacter sp. C03]